MISIDLSADESVVAVGAHPDDIEIAAGGTLLHLADHYPRVKFHLIVLTSNPQRAEEAKKSALALLGDRTLITVGEFRDAHLPYDDPAGVKDWLSEAAAETNPGLVLAPWTRDEHQDHRFAGALAWQVFRKTPILEYEVPKWESERFQPNVLVPLTDAQMARKLDHLELHFSSQHKKPWYDRELFAGMLRVRGIEHGNSRYAEGFAARKVAISIP